MCGSGALQPAIDSTERMGNIVPLSDVRRFGEAILSVLLSPRDRAADISH